MKYIGLLFTSALLGLFTFAQGQNQLNVNTNAKVVISNNVVVTLNGNLINNGSIITTAPVGDADTIQFTGATEQEISGTGTNIFGHFKIKNSGGVKLSNTVTVKGNLYLANGPLKLNRNTLIIDNPLAGAITRTDGSLAGSGYIVSETPDADNKSIVQWNIGTTTGPHVFPFGTITGEYIPVTFNNSGDAGNVSVSTRPTGADNTPFAAGCTDMTGGGGTITAVTTAIDRWWSIKPSLPNPLTDPVTITLTYEGIQNTITSPASTLGFQHWAGSYWNDGKGGALGTYSSTGSAGVTSGLASITATGMTEFSPYVIVSINAPLGGTAPLPVELLGFSASCNNQNIIIEWSTASESDNDYFTLEKSYDTRNWTSIMIIDGQGNSSINTHYSITDTTPTNNAENTAYYRLRQTNFDGTSSYSDVIHTSCGNIPDLNVLVYPNPADNFINCDITSSVNTSVNISIIDVLGRHLTDRKAAIAPGENKQSFDVSALAPAVYYLEIKTSDGLYKDGRQVIVR